MTNLTTLTEIKRIARLDATTYGYCEHQCLNYLLHDSITSIDQEYEYVSNEVKLLQDCRSKVLDMDLDYKQENKHLCKIYMAIVRQHNLDVKYTKVSVFTNNIIEQY